MLGFPFSIQNDVFEELEYSPEETVLLFQLDSDEEDLEVLWGESGILYFCIDKTSLNKKLFYRCIWHVYSHLSNFEQFPRVQ
jgi:uncharacterized protein YwqG